MMVTLQIPTTEEMSDGHPLWEVAIMHLWQPSMLVAILVQTIKKTILPSLRKAWRQRQILMGFEQMRPRSRS